MQYKILTSEYTLILETFSLVSTHVINICDFMLNPSTE